MEENPYSPTIQSAVESTQSTTESTLQRNWISRLLLKALMTSVWTLVFFFGSVIVLGTTSGIYFALTSATTAETSEQSMQWVIFSWTLIPKILGTTGFLLSVFGLLPGTRWNL